MEKLYSKCDYYTVVRHKFTIATLTFYRRVEIDVQLIAESKFNYHM